MSLTSTCYTCGRDFDPYNNMGQLDCGYHSGHFKYDEARHRYCFYYWTCCNGLKGSPGCVKCDHSVMNELDRNRDVKCKLAAFEGQGGKVKMPKKENIIEYCAKFKIEKNIKVICGDTSYIRVKRVL